MASLLKAAKKKNLHPIQNPAMRAKFENLTDEEMLKPEELRDFPNNFDSMGDPAKDKWLETFLQLQWNEFVQHVNKEVRQCQLGMIPFIPGTVENQINRTFHKLGIRKDHLKILREFQASDPRHMEWARECGDRCTQKYKEKQKKIKAMKSKKRREWRSKNKPGKFNKNGESGFKHKSNDPHTGNGSTGFRCGIEDIEKEKKKRPRYSASAGKVGKPFDVEQFVAHINSDSDEEGCVAKKGKVCTEV